MKKKKEINKLCQKCVHTCKQSVDIELLGCPKFEKKPRQIKFNLFQNIKKV